MKGCVPLRRAWPFSMKQVDDEHLIFLRQASMGIKRFAKEKKNLCKKYIGKSV